MANTTNLSFNGGEVGSGGQTQQGRTIRNVCMQWVEIVESGRETEVCVLCDKDTPISEAPNYNPVSPEVLAKWIDDGDYVQIDPAGWLEYDEDSRARAFLDYAEFVNEGGVLKVSLARAFVIFDVIGDLPSMVERYTFRPVTDQRTDAVYIIVYDSYANTINTVVATNTDLTPGSLEDKLQVEGALQMHRRQYEDGDEYLAIGMDGQSSEVKCTSMDNSSGFLAEKLTATDGIKAEVVTDSEGDQHIEISPDEQAADPLAKLSDIEQIVESRTFESMPVGTVSSSVQNLHDSTGRLTISLCHPVMDFEIRKRVVNGSTEVQAPTKASIYISNIDPSATPAQKVRIVVFKGIEPPGYGQWRFALVAYTDEVEIVNSQDYSSHGKSGDDLKHGILDLPIVQVYGGDDGLFQTPVDKYTVKSTEDMYLGIIATGTTLECPGSEFSGSPKNDMPRLTSAKFNMNSGWNPADYTGHTKDIDVNTTSMPDGKRVYIELHNV